MANNIDGSEGLSTETEGRNEVENLDPMVSEQESVSTLDMSSDLSSMDTSISIDSSGDNVPLAQSEGKSNSNADGSSLSSDLDDFSDESTISSHSLDSSGNDVPLTQSQSKSNSNDDGSSLSSDLDDPSDVSAISSHTLVSSTSSSLTTSSGGTDDLIADVDEGMAVAEAIAAAKEDADVGTEDSVGRTGIIEQETEKLDEEDDESPVAMGTPPQSTRMLRRYSSSVMARPDRASQDLGNAIRWLESAVGATHDVACQTEALFALQALCDDADARMRITRSRKVMAYAVGASLYGYSESDDAGVAVSHGSWPGVGGSSGSGGVGLSLPADFEEGESRARTEAALQAEASAAATRFLDAVTRGPKGILATLAEAGFKGAVKELLSGADDVQTRLRIGVIGLFGDDGSAPTPPPSPVKGSSRLRGDFDKPKLSMPQPQQNVRRLKKRLGDKQRARIFSALLDLAAREPTTPKSSLLDLDLRTPSSIALEIISMTLARYKGAPEHGFRRDFAAISGGSPSRAPLQIVEVLEPATTVDHDARVEAFLEIGLEDVLLDIAGRHAVVDQEWEIAWRALRAICDICKGRWTIMRRRVADSAGVLATVKGLLEGRGGIEGYEAALDLTAELVGAAGCETLSGDSSFELSRAVAEIGPYAVLHAATDCDNGGATKIKATRVLDRFLEHSNVKRMFFEEGLFEAILQKSAIDAVTSAVDDESAKMNALEKVA